MRPSSRTFALSLLLALFAGTAPSVSAGAFSDVRDAATPYARAIEALRARGVVQGYADGTFRPGATINRAEFLKIILESRGDVSGGSDCFPDVRDDWYARYVCAAKAEGIVGGYPDGTFKPERTINFVEAAKILSLAYDQQVESSGEWYEGYARAIESSKAIPPSITGLEKLITRSEMAEMMWRLSEGVTGEPAKGYLNVKYPELSVNLASEEPQKAKTCADLSAFAAEAQKTGMMRNRVMLEERGIALGAVPSQAMGKAQDAGYSRTNVQVTGVDEADIVKTDGTYLYAVQGAVIRIIRARPAETMKVLSTINLDNAVFTPSELFLEGDRLVVLSSGWRDGPIRIMQGIAPSIYPPVPSVQRTEVRIYDISDRGDPRLARTLEFDGALVSSRRIENRVYLVMNQGFRWIQPMPLLQEQDILPMYRDSAQGASDKPATTCAEVVILPRVPQPEYLIVATVPLASPSADVKREVIVGSARNLYMSLENLYVASTEWAYFWRGGSGRSEEKTHLYRFALTGDGVAFKARGDVPGHILNQFSMDEHGQTFHVATTVGEMWDAARPSMNNLYVLNRDLERLGAVTDIAPGEQIYSVRFMGDRAYMVTFKKTDPFFVIDTSDPANPRILGQLKIPGYSDYLHPYDETHILGFGKEAEAAKEGDFAWYQGMKVALFDVTDPGDPREMSTVTIGDRGTQSPLLQNHKALLFDRERGLLAFPVSVAKISAERKQTGSWDMPAWGDTVFQGAYVYDVDLADGLRLRGTITHYGENDFMKAGSTLYGKNIERIVRIGDAFLTVGQDRVVSSDERTVEQKGEVVFAPPIQ